MVTSPSFTIQGRLITFPVEVQSAMSWAAQYMVDLEAAQALVDPTGLEVAQPRPGKAIVSLVFVRYLKSDLDPYNELGVAVLVRRHDATPKRAPAKALEVIRGNVGVYIHRLPVNKSFTLEAGRTIWGYPKFRAEVGIRDEGEEAVCELADGERQILTLAVKNGYHFTLKTRAFPTYTFDQDVLRLTNWTMPKTVKIGGRFGGARLELGERGQMVEELRALGLPKRAFMTQTITAMRASFEPPLFVR